ncbi:membrane dipeptidase [Candidatus Poribacteria bacterium]
MELSASTFFSVFLDQEFKDQSDKDLKPPPPSLSKVIEHINHIANIGGIDSVGIGSDYDGMNPPPKGLEDVSKMPRITEALLGGGYSAEDCAKIMGGNFLRVFGQVCGD